jgi:hypothetical protein
MSFTRNSATQAVDTRKCPSCSELAFAWHPNRRLDDPHAYAGKHYVNGPVNFASLPRVTNLNRVNEAERVNGRADDP